MDLQNKKDIVKKIETLNKKQLLKLFKLIIDLDVTYTRNMNGIFIDMNRCSEYQIKCIENILDSI